MGINTVELRTERASLADKMQKIATKAYEEKRSFSSEENQEFDRLKTGIAELKTRIDQFEQVNEVETELQEKRSTGIGRETKEIKVENPEARKLEAWRSFIINGTEDMPSHLRSELRSLSLAGTSGYTAPSEQTSEYIDILRNFTDIRQAPVTVINTASGNTIPFPSLDDTANLGAITAETVDTGDAGDPTVGQINLSSFMVTSGVLKVSQQFLRDSLFPAEKWLNDHLAERLAAKQNKYLTTGTATGQPGGIVTGAGTGVTLSTGHSTAIGVGSSGTDYAGIAKDTINNLLSLQHSVIKRYRVPGQCGWMFNDNVLKGFKGLTDGQGRLLWQPGLASNEPDTLLGQPIYINTDMADPAADSKSVLFGNFKYFYIRDVGSITVNRLIERYGELLMVGFLGYHAIDSRVMNSSAIKVMVMSHT